MYRNRLNSCVESRSAPSAMLEAIDTTVSGSFGFASHGPYNPAGVCKRWLQVGKRVSRPPGLRMIGRAFFLPWEPFCFRHDVQCQGLGLFS